MKSPSSLHKYFVARASSRQVPEIMFHGGAMPALTSGAGTFAFVHSFCVYHSKTYRKVYVLQISSGGRVPGVSLPPSQPLAGDCKGISITFEPPLKQKVMEFAVRHGCLQQPACTRRFGSAHILSDKMTSKSKLCSSRTGKKEQLSTQSLKRI